MSTLQFRILIFISVILSLTLQSMQLDNLDAFLIGNIIVQLNNSIGTPSLINEKDIPVIVKNVKMLSFTNKSLYNKINDITNSRIFIKALANRFGRTQLNAIGQINTPGARLVINELLEPGEYEVFKAVQRIIEIADVQIEEFEKFKGFWLERGQSACPRIDKCSVQTKQGLVIMHDRYFPSRLATPWGVVRLFGSGGWMGNRFLAFTQEFFKNFKTTYMYLMEQKLCDGENSYEFAHLLEFVNSKPIVDLKEALLLDKEINTENVFKKIIVNKLSKCALKEKDGTECYIGIDQHDTYYKIHEVEGIPLPDPVMQQWKLRRDDKITGLIWQMFKKRYDRENGKVEEICQEKKEAPRVICCATEQNRKFKTMIDLSQMCDLYLEQLDKQPLSREQKKLSFDDSVKCKLMYLLCWWVNHKIDKKSSWRVKDFEHWRCDGNNDYVKRGLVEYIPSSKLQTRCSLEQMKVYCHKLFDEIGTGWRKSSLADNPDIMCRQSEEEWSLFLKQEFAQESNLINFIIIALGFDGVGCYNHWRTTEGDFEDDFEFRNMMYLWVNKKILDCFIQAFNLKFAI